MFGLFKKKLDIEEFIAGSVEGLKMTTDAHSGTWHLGEEKTWDVDQDNGQIKTNNFVFPFDAIAKRVDNNEVDFFHNIFLVTKASIENANA